MQKRTYERMEQVAAHLWHGRAVGKTAYELAKLIGCRPTTIRLNVARYGAEFGIDCTEVQHRPNVTKKLYHRTVKQLWGELSCQ